MQRSDKMVCSEKRFWDLKWKVIYSEEARKDLRTIYEYIDTNHGIVKVFELFL